MPVQPKPPLIIVQTTKNPGLLAFGHNLKYFRLRAGLSQEFLAGLAGIDRSYLSAVERGEHNIALLNILKLASALNIHPSLLFECFDGEKS